MIDLPYDDLEPVRAPDPAQRRAVVGPCSIYVLVDPRDGRVRYVGKTHGTLEKRLASHVANARKPPRRRRVNHRQRWIAALLREGVQPCIKLIEAVEGDGCEAECRWIAHHRAQGADLVNGTDGGEGTPGWIADDAFRQRMSEVHKGKPLAPEHCDRIADALRGKPKSPSHRAAIGLVHRGKTLTDEHKQAISDNFRGKSLTQAHKDKIAEAARLRWQDPEFRRKMRDR